jgi:predicted transcriptional regulator
MFLCSALGSGGILLKIIEFGNINEGVGEAYICNQLESRQIPIYEDRSKSTYNITPKAITSTTLH